MKNNVSLLIVSYNVRQYIAHAIDSIIKSDFNDFEMIIIDNNSFDNTVPYLKERYSHLRQIRVIHNKENVGFGRAVNQAATLAKGQYYLILNPDTIIQEETISTLRDYLEDNPDVGMVGPKILNADGTLQLACKRSFPTLGVAFPKLLGLSRFFPKSKWAGKYNLTYIDEDQISSVDANITISSDEVKQRMKILIEGDVDAKILSHLILVCHMNEIHVREASIGNGEINIMVGWKDGPNSLRLIEMALLSVPR